MTGFKPSSDIHVLCTGIIVMCRFTQKTCIDCPLHSIFSFLLHYSVCFNVLISWNSTGAVFLVASREDVCNKLRVSCSCG